jgi:hypothetical protein
MLEILPTVGSDVRFPAIDSGVRRHVEDAVPVTTGISKTFEFPHL